MNRTKNVMAAALSGAIAFAYIFYFISTIMGLVDVASIGGGGIVTSSIILSVVTLIVAIAAFVIFLVALFKLVGKTHYGNPISLFFLGLVLVSFEKVINSIGVMIIFQSYYPGFSVDSNSIVAMAFFVISLVLFVVTTALSKGKSKGAVGIVGSIASLFFLIPLFMSLSSKANALASVYIIVLLISYIGVFGYFVFYTVSEFMSNPVISPTKEEETHVTLEKKVEPTYSKVDAEQALLRLKRLLDQGVISEEEYNEKRKKYVDSL